MISAAKPRVRASLVALAFIVLGGLIVLRPDPREAMARRVVDALERGDAAALLALASEQEIERLHLTEGSVRAFLRKTCWSKGQRHDQMDCRLDPLMPTDTARYRAWLAGTGNRDQTETISIWFEQTPAGEWRFLLSLTILESLGLHRPPGLSRNGPVAYSQIARPLGIRGFLNRHGGWVIFDTPWWRRYERMNGNARVEARGEAR